MRYAGITLAPEKKPSHADRVALPEDDVKQLKQWFQSRTAGKQEPEREPLLEVKNLSFGYTKGQRTLQNVSLTIRKGEMVSIVGKNGAGKSTFSKLVCGFEDPDQ